VHVPAWTAPFALATGGTLTHFQPSVAAGRSGDAVVAWTASDGTGLTGIQARRFSRANGWSTTDDLRSRESGRYSTDPQAGLDGSGRAIVTFAEAELGLGDRAMASGSPLAGGWSDPVALGSLPASNHKPRIAVNAAGAAMVFWGGGAARYTPSGGWEAAATINAASPIGQRIAIDAAGNAWAVWMQVTNFRAYGARYTVGTGWSTEAMILGGQAGPPDVAMSGAGAALALVPQYGINPDNNADYNLWARRHTGSAWVDDGAQIDGESNGRSYNPRAGVDGAGNAIAVWEQWGNIPSPGVQAARFTPQGGWSAPVLIGPEGQNPELAVHPSGAAVAIWIEYPPNAWALRASRCAPGGAWSTVETIASGVDGVSFYVLAMDADGVPFVAWEDCAAKCSVWTSRFE
jgi:hypothetical protein